MPFSIAHSDQIRNRNEFASYCIKHNLDKVVEVGLDRGHFAADFLRVWKEANFGRIYLGVDAYRPYPEMEWDRSADKAMAVINLAEFRTSKIVVADSVQMARHASYLRDKHGLYGAPFGMVYLDAGHTFEDVQADIALWWPLIQTNGILAGHDWSMHSGEHGGVKQAVIAFATQKNLPIFTTSEDDPTSWYIQKV